MDRNRYKFYPIIYTKDTYRCYMWYKTVSYTNRNVAFGCKIPKPRATDELIEPISICKL